MTNKEIEDEEQGVTNDSSDFAKSDDGRKSLTQGKFLDIDMLMNILKTIAPKEIMDHVSQGEKGKVFCVVSNKDNLLQHISRKPHIILMTLGPWAMVQ